MMPSRCCILYVSKSGRPNSGHRTGKDRSSSQFPRRVILKNVLTMGQLHSFPMLIKSCLKSCTLSLQHYVNQKLRDVQFGFRKGKGTRDQIVSVFWIIEKARELKTNKKNLPLFHRLCWSLFFFFFFVLKPLTVWIIINCGKLLKRREYQTILSVSWEVCMEVKQQEFEL